MAMEENLGPQFDEHKELSKASYQYKYHGFIPQLYGGYSPEEAPSVHHFTAHNQGVQVGFLQLFDGSHEVANIETDTHRKGIGTGLISFAKQQGFHPTRSDAESEEGESFFDKLENNGLL